MDKLMIVVESCWIRDGIIEYKLITEIMLTEKKILLNKTITPILGLARVTNKKTR